MSFFNVHRHTGVLDCFSSGDLKNAVAIAGLELLSVEAVGEAEAAAPSAIAEFAEHGRCTLIVRCGRAFGACLLYTSPSPRD